MVTTFFAEFPLVSIAVRSLPLLAITLGIAWACRRRSAAVVHHVWVLGFLGCLLIPMVSLLMPGMALPVLPKVTQAEMITSAALPAEPNGNASWEMQSGNVRRENMRDMRYTGPGSYEREPRPQRGAEVMPSAPAEAGSEAEAAQLAASSSPAAGAPFAWPSPATRLLIVWCMGAAIGAARQLQGAVFAALAVRRCAPLEGESWYQLRDDVARQLGLRRVVPLRSHAGAVTPMVVGCWRPVILLPSDASRWTYERRRQVLLHELAHVERYDVLTQMIAGLCCAVYWFNPLAWWGAAEMKRLREIACDDVVVAHTSRPSSYAETLLNVAKEYRCRQQVGTVAMARTAQVESRIRAILDATRRRAKLSKPAARMVGIAAIAISIVVGSLQLTTRAEEPESPDKPANADKSVTAEKAKQAGPEGEKASGKEVEAKSPVAEEEAAKDPKSAELKVTEANDTEANDAEVKKTEVKPAARTRTMTIRVLDEAGKPISDANVFASIWAVEPDADRPPNRNYKTNEEGVALVELPERLRILRLWPSKEGYVPLFVNFAEGMHDDGQSLPEVYEFRMQPGAKLSGVIVDDAGMPVKDARVDVSFVAEHEYWGRNPKPIVSTWLAEDEGAAVTDENGRWEITNAPPPREKSDYRFRLMVTHPDFAGDRQRGELQAKQGITTEQLRAGTARLTLDRGFAVQGTITGPDGKPVTEGLVIWDDRPYWAEGVNETQIGADGKYETLRLLPGEYPITVVTPGFAPQQRKIKVNAALGAVDFKLEPGHPLTIRIVDEAGKPIPKARMSIGEWRGTEALYNYDHPNVPDSRIPRSADEEGIYRWTWAPDDGVSYQIGKTGYATKKLTLVAKPEPHTVVLPSPVTIFGRVTDAETGKPIERFRVIPVTEFHPDFYSTDFQSNRVVEGKDGEYRIEFDTYGEEENRYRVRIEAEGYRTAFGEKSLVRGDRPVEEDFQLEPAAALRSAVVDASGAPVNKFNVAVGTPTTSPGFTVDYPNESFGIAFEVTSKNTFELPATFEPQRIRVYNRSGFAEVVREGDEPIETITLQPWASVSGRLVQDGKPVAGSEIYLFPLVLRGLTAARFQDGHSVKTDADGRFQFERVPPMRYSVRPALGPWGDSALSSGRSVVLDLKPGEKVELLLGGEGATVTGQVVATGENAETLSKRWSLNYLITRKQRVPYPSDAIPLGFDPSGPVEVSWLREPMFAAWVATRENFYVKLPDDGKLRIEGVPPGEYDLTIQLYEQPAGCLVESIGEKVVPVTIEAGQAAAVVDLGEIEVACRRGPRVGSDMRAYEFVDAEGRVRKVNDLAGRYVVFQVWASWCRPCLASMPAVKGTIERYGPEQLTVVGLNIDKDADAGKALAASGGWNWAQNYLGSDSDLMRQLGVSSAPAYYLIGPDGKLLQSTVEWEEIEKVLNAELAEK